MTLLQVKEELEYFFVNNRMLSGSCVSNSIMLAFHWNTMQEDSWLRKRGVHPCYLLDLRGHQVNVCIKRKVLVDPTVGCIWRVNKINESFLKRILKGLPPDEHLSWFDERTYKYWWDYTTKYEKNKHKFNHRDEWDVDLNVNLSTISLKRYKQFNLGKFSDYMRSYETGKKEVNT